MGLLNRYDVSKNSSVKVRIQQPVILRRLLSDLCQKIGVELDDEGPIRYLFEAMEDFLEDDEDNEDDGQTEAESLEKLSNMLMSLPDDALRQMPPYLLRDVNRLADDGLLPLALTERLRKLR